MNPRTAATLAVVLFAVILATVTCCTVVIYWWANFSPQPEADGCRSGQCLAGRSRDRAGHFVYTRGRLAFLGDKGEVYRAGVAKAKVMKSFPRYINENASTWMKRGIREKFLYAEETNTTEFVTICSRTQEVCSINDSCTHYNYLVCPKRESPGDTRGDFCCGEENSEFCCPATDGSPLTSKPENRNQAILLSCLFALVVLCSNALTLGCTLLLRWKDSSSSLYYGENDTEDYNYGQAALRHHHEYDSLVPASPMTPRQWLQAERQNNKRRHDTRVHLLETPSPAPIRTNSARLKNEPIYLSC